MYWFWKYEGYSCLSMTDDVLKNEDTEYYSRDYSRLVSL